MINTLIIYEDSKESTESLSNLSKIFLLAEYPNDSLTYLPLKDITSEILKEYSSIFCINDTYHNVSNIIANIYDLNLYEFSLKEYFDIKLNLQLFGISLTIEEMTSNQTHKRYVWKTIQKFVKNTLSLKNKNITKSQIVEVEKEVQVNTEQLVSQELTITVPSLPIESKIITAQEIDLLIQSFNNITKVLSDLKNKLPIS